MNFRTGGSLSRAEGSTNSKQHPGLRFNTQTPLEDRLNAPTLFLDHFGHCAAWNQGSQGGRHRLLVYQFGGQESRERVVLVIWLVPGTAPFKIGPEPKPTFSYQTPDINQPHAAKVQAISTVLKKKIIKIDPESMEIERAQI